MGESTRNLEDLMINAETVAKSNQVFKLLNRKKCKSTLINLIIKANKIK